MKIRKSFFPLIISLIISLLLQANLAFAFYSDVSLKTPYYDSIKKLYDLGMLPATQDNKLNPNAILKITDFYTLVLSFVQIPLSTKVNLPFSNTNNNATYAPYLQTALDLGLLKQKKNSNILNLDETMSKGNVLKSMFDVLGIGVNYFFDKTSFPFVDLKSNSASAAMAQKAAEIGILEKDSSKMFKMSKRITNAEAIDYLYKIYQYALSSGEETTESVPQKATIIITPINVYDDSGLSESKSFGTFLDVWNDIKNNYYYQDEVDDQKLLWGAIEGMVGELKDHYTVFQRPDKDASFLDVLSGEYEGIGMYIELIDKNVTIVAPFSNSPAEKAGIKSGDIILEVDGKNVTGTSIESVAAKIKGPKGTTVKLKISRSGQTLTFNIVRSAIQNKSVNYEVKASGRKSVGYINIVSFGDDTYSQFLAAAKDLLINKSSGFVIDLRNNPGGYMDVATDIISLFTNETKTAVKLEFSDGSSRTYKTSGNGLLNGYKVVILTNKGSASAAEIMAGALQDYGIATVIGEQSFGKGTVQQVVQFRDNSLFKYTISKWLTPNGRDINKIGITPDKVVIKADDSDNQLASALAEF